MEYLLVMDFRTNIWVDVLLVKRMQSKLGAKEASLSGRTELESVRNATRDGRKIVRKIVIRTIDFHFHFHYKGLPNE